MNMHVLQLTEQPRRISNPWTPAEDGRLVRLAAAGLSASQIALRLGRDSRMSVISRAHRKGVHLLGKPGNPNPAKPPKAPRPAKEALPPVKLQACPAVKSKRKAKTPQPGMPLGILNLFEATLPGPFEAGVAPYEQRSGATDAVAALKHGQCAWPYGEPADDSFHYCSHHTKLKSIYCPLHHDRVYLS